MNRRSFIQTSVFTFAALTIAQQKIFAALKIDPWKVTMLTDSTGIFTEKGGTILFHLSKKGIVVIDTQFADAAAHLIAELNKKSQKPFKLLVNTHHHGDHTSGNIAFKDLLDTIVAHENSKINQQTVAIKNKSEDKQLYPNTTYSKKWSKKIGKEKIHLYYFGAGHTNGDSIVHLQHENIVHMGDLVFNRRHPYIDKTAGANIKNWIIILEKTQVLFNDNTKFVCGHAGNGYDVVVTKADIKAFANYLQKVLEFTQAEIAAGKTKEEILKATTIPGAEEWKGEGIERSLTAAFIELTTK
ncbi:MAG: MBL fold metallo-hydrolase [Chitinophagaceae bacterium]|nr:MBL fold metallo-hydrolase [Chitinophagaceae bacterium]